MILRQSCRYGPRHRHFGGHRSLPRRPHRLAVGSAQAPRRVGSADRARRTGFAGGRGGTRATIRPRGTGEIGKDVFVIIPASLEHGFTRATSHGSRVFPLRRGGKPKFLRYLAAGLPRLIGHRLRGRLYDDRLERLLDFTPRAPARAQRSLT